MRVSPHEGDDLATVFAQVGRGIYPPFDSLTEVVSPPDRVPAAVFAFTGHHIVAADIDRLWVEQRCPPGDLLAPVSPDFLLALGERLGCRPGSLCLVLCGSGRAREPTLDLKPVDPGQVHPRIVRAHRYRTDVRVYQTPDGEGLLTLGRGIGGRWEAGFEVGVEHQNRGLGHQLVVTALHLIEPDEGLFMEVAIGNIASIRAVLRAGFVPIGAEVLFVSGSQ